MIERGLSPKEKEEVYTILDTKRMNDLSIMRRQKTLISGSFVVIMEG